MATARADDIGRPGVITVQIVQRIFDANLVVADLSDRNPNVYYELAIRHATKKPAVHIISEGQDIPFDVQDMRVVPYDLTDPDSLEKARGKLREYITAIEEGETIITPVQFAQILRSLEADEGRDRQLRALFESLNVGISNLQAGMGEIVQAVREQRQSEAWQEGVIRGLMRTPTLTPTPSILDLTSPPASGFTVPLSSLAGALEKARTQNKAAAIKKAKESKDKK